MEHVFEELSKREDLVLILALLLAIVIGLTILWLLRILFQTIKNDSGTGELTEVVRELAVKNTASQQDIARQLNLSSRSLGSVTSKLAMLDKRFSEFEQRQTQVDQVLASATLVLQRLQTTSSQTDLALRAEIDEHETNAIERSNQNLEVAQQILQKVSGVPGRMATIEEQQKKIVGSIGDIRKAQREDKQHLMRIQTSVMEAITESENRSAMIKQILEMLQSTMESLKALQDKPLEVTAVYAPSGGESA